MGKLIFFIIILIFLDLFFFIFINPESFTLTSVIWLSLNSIISGSGWSAITSILINPIFARLLVLAALVTGAGILLQRFTGGTVNTETLIWTTIASTFIVSIGADFLVVFRRMANIKPPLTTILALILMTPMIIIFMFLLLEWIRGKD